MDLKEDVVVSSMTKQVHSFSSIEEQVPTLATDRLLGVVKHHALHCNACMFSTVFFDKEYSMLLGQGNLQASVQTDRQI
jgi:hypothetical protein